MFLLQPVKAVQTHDDLTDNYSHIRDHGQRLYGAETFDQLKLIVYGDICADESP